MHACWTLSNAFSVSRPGLTWVFFLSFWSGVSFWWRRVVASPNCTVNFNLQGALVTKTAGVCSGDKSPWSPLVLFYPCMVAAKEIPLDAEFWWNGGLADEIKKCFLCLSMQLILFFCLLKFFCSFLLWLRKSPRASFISYLVIGFIVLWAEMGVEPS